MDEYLFSYGTLQDRKVQLDLFGRLLNGAKDQLKGYKLSEIQITDELFLSKGEQQYQRIATFSNNKKIVEGRVFEGSKEELAICDKCEPNEYPRIEVELESGKRAWIYATKQPKAQDCLETLSERQLALN